MYTSKFNFKNTIFNTSFIERDGAIGPLVLMSYFLSIFLYFFLSFFFFILKMKLFFVVTPSIHLGV